MQDARARWAFIVAALCAACGSGGKADVAPAASPTPTASPTPAAVPTPAPTSVPAAGPTPAPTSTAAGLPPSGPQGAGACVPATCSSVGKNCGTVDDGCGGTLYCGTCTQGQVCGAGGAANVCGSPAASCTPTTCQALRASCGRLPDACGGTLDCGSCSGAETCGGGGTPNACGSPPAKGGDTRWVAYVAGPDGESVERVRADADGNVYVAGLVAGDRAALFVRKHRSDGGFVWEKRWAAAQARTFIWVAGFGVSLSGDSYVAFGTGCAADPCGLDPGGGRIDFGVVKLGADGSFSWQKPLSAYSLAVGPHGEVAFPTWGDASGKTFQVLDATGAVAWSGTLNNAHAFAFDPDAALLVAWNDASNNWAPKLSKLSAGGAATAWTRDTQGYVQYLATSARGTVVAAESNQLAVYEAADGAQRFRVSIPLWAADLAVRPGIHDVVEAVAVGQDQAGCGQMEARAYDLAGTFRWVRLVGPTVGCGGSPAARGVAILDSGDVVVGGAQTTNTDFGQGDRAPEGASDGFLLDLAP